MSERLIDEKPGPTYESLRQLEDSLTPAQRERAFDLARQNGWTTGEAPMWVWQQLFLQAKGVLQP